MQLRCAICECKLNESSKIKTFFCSKCYQLYKDDIITKEPWTVYLQNLETSRRRSKSIEDMYTIIYLGDMWDVSEDGILVRRYAVGE